MSSLSLGLEENFLATSNQRVISSCPCSTTSNTITLSNIGPIESTYYIDIISDTARWATLTPTMVTLKPGETKEITDYISVPCSAEYDNYKHQVRIRTEFGKEKILEQELNINRCQNIKVTSKTLSKRTCPCQPVMFSFTLENTGDFFEDYKISAKDTIEEWILFSEDEISLIPKDSKEFFLYITPPCDIYGEYNIDLFVEAKRSRSKAKIPLLLNINPCYDYDISLGKETLVLPGQEEISFTYESNDKSYYYLCENSKFAIPVKVTNDADVNNKFFTELVSPQWALFQLNDVLLYPKKDFVSPIFIETQLYDAGTYNFTLKSTSERGSIRKETTIPIVVDWCYTPMISTDIEKIRVNYSINHIPLNFENKGTRDSIYTLALIDSPQWLSLEKTTFNLASKDSSILNIISTPSADIKKGTYKANILVESEENNAQYMYSFEIKLRDKGFFSGLSENIADNILWITLIVFILFLVLIGIIAYIKKSKDSKGTTKERISQVKLPKEAKKQVIKEEKTATFIEKVKTSKIFSNRWLLWISAILILLLIIILVAFLLRNVWPGFWGYFAYVGAQILKYLIIAKNFIIKYLWYILIGLALLIIIIYILYKTKEKAQKKRLNIPWKKIITWLILLIILLGLGYGIYKLMTMPKTTDLDKDGEAIFIFDGVGDSQEFIVYDKKHTATVQEINSDSTTITIESDPIEVNLPYGLPVQVDTDNDMQLDTELLSTLLENGSVQIILKKVEYPIEPKTSIIKKGYDEAKVLSKYSWNKTKNFIVYRHSLEKQGYGTALLPYIYDKSKILVSSLKEFSLKTKDFMSKTYFSTLDNLRENIQKEEVSDDRQVEIEEQYEEETSTDIVEEDSDETEDLQDIAEEPADIAESEEENKELEEDISNIYEEEQALDEETVGKLSESISETYYEEDEEETYEEYQSDMQETQDIYEESEEIDEIIDETVQETQEDMIYATDYEKEEQGLFSWMIEKITNPFNKVSEESAEVEEEIIEEIIIEDEGIETRVWEEDTSIIIDLNLYFSDPDNDKLIFSNTPVEDIEITIDENGMATLTPAHNFHGKRNVVFIGDDTKGGIVESNNVSLYVLAVAEPSIIKVMYDNSKNFFLSYLNYIVLGFLILIILILVTKYYKPISEFFDEEEVKKDSKKKKASKTKKK